MKETDLSWTKECIISECIISITPGTAGNLNARPLIPAMAARQITGATFQLNNANLHVPVVTLSIIDIKFLENVKQRFKRKISWSKCRSERKIQPKNNNLDYLIHPLFKNIIRLFVLSFKNCNDDPTSINH